MRGFVAHLEDQRNELDYLIDLLKVRIDAKELEIELTAHAPTGLHPVC